MTPKVVVPTAPCTKGLQECRDRVQVSPRVKKTLQWVTKSHGALA